MKVSGAAGKRIVGGGLAATRRGARSGRAPLRVAAKLLWERGPGREGAKHAAVVRGMDFAVCYHDLRPSSARFIEVPNAFPSAPALAGPSRGRLDALRRRHEPRR